VTPLALGLVVLAALGHATWNLLTKQSRHQLAFLWCTGVAGTGFFLPVVVWTTGPWRWSASAWAGLVLAALVRAAYLATLSVAYGRGDLSLVYPLARGIAPVLVPPVAALVLGERPTGIGIVGIMLVGLGVYVLHLPALGRPAWLAPIRAVRAAHAGPAVLTGCFTTVYSVLDAWNVRRGLPPVLYAWATIPVALLLLTPLVRRTPAALGEIWRGARLSIVLVAVLMTGGYLLILFAVRIAPVSYVAPARELSIVFATLLGVAVLGERHPAPRLAGAALILAGVLLLGAAGA
jgi:drug/metabolite transporter (DMT)-like permease